MKIYIQNIRPNMSPYNGKGKFVRRLAKELECRKGIEIVKYPENCDINFAMNHLPRTRCGKRVVRLDGHNFTLSDKESITSDKGDFRLTMLNADGIIYQSDYIRKVLIKYLGYDDDESANYRIIPNGVDPYDFKPEIDLNTNKRYFLFACQTLHPIRRLEALLNVWQQYNSKYWLYVVFDHTKNMTDIDFSLYRNVKVFNIMEQSDLNRLMKSAIAVINLTYRDGCPNLLIESLACDCPVIADKENGIWEYISNIEGQCVDITLPNNNGNYPIKNPQDIIAAMEYCRINPRRIELPSRLKIRHVADEYIKFFKELIAV